MLTLTPPCYTCCTYRNRSRRNPQAFSSSRVPDDLKSTSPRDGGSNWPAAAGVGAAPQLPLGPAVLQDFTASFVLPELTPGAHGMRLELSPRRVRRVMLSRPAVRIWQ